MGKGILAGASGGVGVDIPITSEIPANADIWIDPSEEDQSGNFYTKEETYNKYEAYNKDEVLSSYTKSMFGFGENTNPNDVFEHLGQYNQHWWVRTGAHPAHYVLSDTVAAMTPAYFSNKYTYYYSDSITVAVDGKISLVEPISSAALTRAIDVTTDSSSVEDWSVITNKFYYREDEQIIRYAASAPYKSDNVIKVPYKSVTGVPQTSDGETVYITSVNRNAHPDNGTEDGMIYQYIGVPFNNAVNSYENKIQCVGKASGLGGVNSFYIELKDVISKYKILYVVGYGLQGTSASENNISLYSVESLTSTSGNVICSLKAGKSGTSGNAYTSASTVYLITDSDNVIYVNRLSDTTTFNSISDSKYIYCQYATSGATVTLQDTCRIEIWGFAK